MNNNDITAEEAYKETVKTIETLKNKEYEDICLDIKSYIAKGNFEFYGIIEYIETISKLRGNGFKIEKFSDRYKISWDKE